MRKALVYKHPYLGILACCFECGRTSTYDPGNEDLYLMLPPASSTAWDQGTLAAAHEVAHAHMRDQHPVTSGVTT